jgi:hypothetical protein
MGGGRVKHTVVSSGLQRYGIAWPLWWATVDGSYAITLRSAATKRSVSSGVVVLTRHQSSMGGKGRPTSIPRAAKAAATSLAGRPVWKNTMFPWLFT